MRGYEITNSERSCAGRCKQRHLLAYMLWLEPARAQRALQIGSAWHELQDILWTSGHIEAGSALEQMKVLALSLPDEYDPANPNDKARQLKDLDMLGKMLDGYVDRWGLDEFTLVHSEKSRVARLRSPSGRTAKWVRVTGQIDKIVLIKGERWLIEHKTTSRPLYRWRVDNDYNPQGSTYSLIQRAIKQPVVGVVYDLAHKSSPAKAEDFPVNKDGSLSKSKVANATSAGFNAACSLAVRRTGKTADWWQERYTQLKSQDDRFFSREWVRFSEAELDRVERELYHHATELRQSEQRLLKSHNVTVQAIRHGALDEVPALLRDIAHLYPRNSGGCYMYNRPCEYMDLCRYQSHESLSQLKPKNAKHVELVAKETKHESQRTTHTETVPRHSDLW